MPALGMAQDTGLLVAWHKQPGDLVKVGDILMEVETDKSTMEVEAQADGYLSDVSAGAGEDVPVGNVIAVISSEKPDPATRAENIVSVAKNTPQPVAAPIAEITVLSNSPTKPVAPENVAPVPQSGRILVSPKAKRLATEAGVDLSALVAAGVPQPYHLSDVETLRSLPASGTGTRTVSSGTTISQISAKVSRTEFGIFVQQMNEEDGINLDPHVIWASFAAKSIRNFAAVESIVVQVRNANDAEVIRLVNPDLFRLSVPEKAADDMPATLVVRDLTDSSITAVRLATDTAPTLSINTTRRHFNLEFSFDETEIAAADAVLIITRFAEQMELPLLSLV